MYKRQVPKTGVVAGVYVQAISAYAPHPNAAKLWMEYLYSDEGQNIWLKGAAFPVRYDAMKAAGKIDAAAQAALPAVNGKVVTELGTRVSPNAAIKVDGKVVRKQAYRYVVLNKPSGFITTKSDERDRRTVMELVHAEYGYLALMDESGEVDCRVSLNAEGQTITGPERNISLSILKRVIAQKKPLLMQDAVNGIRTTTGLQLRSVICAPLTTPRATIGALYLENRSRLAIFQQQDLDPLQLFAAQAAVFIENSLLYSSLERKVSERTLALERRANEMETVNSIGLAILSDLKLGEVLRAVYQQCNVVAFVIGGQDGADG